jgi:hypothetical protein
MSRVAINPKLIIWACERSGQERSALVERFPKLPHWESGDVKSNGVPENRPLLRHRPQYPQHRSVTGRIDARLNTHTMTP